MIITDENAKLLPNNGKKRAAGGSDHETSLTQSSGSAVNPPPYQVYHVQPQVTAQQASSYRSSPARRFWIAFFVAIFVWVLLTTLVESWLNVFSHWSDVFRQGDFPVPSDVSLSQCIIDEKDWSNVPYPSPFPPNSELSARHTGQNYYPYSSSATFELPLSSKSLFLVAKGAQTRGTVNIITSDQVSDVVKVHITVKHISKDVRNRGIKVCLLERPNEIGIGYFTKAWFYPFQHSIYEATVVIPAPAAPVTSRHITAFETDMTNTVHNLGNLQNLVTFGYLSLRSSNSPIHAKSVLADRAIFFTSNGPIKGLYNASRSLSLSTWNAPIHADIALGNEENYVSDLSLQTSNGEIHTRASLTSGSKGGRYMIRAKTSNAPLTFAFPFAPPDSTLRFTASTSNGYARISLNPTYEGLISMITSNGSPSISRREVVDPSGQGRVRRVHTTSLGRNTLKGSVSWSDEEGPSKVELRSSNSPVMIDL